MRSERNTRDGHQEDPIEVIYIQDEKHCLLNENTVNAKFHLSSPWNENWILAEILEKVKPQLKLIWGGRTTHLCF